MIMTQELAANLLPKRQPTQHKGDFGRVLIIGGSLGLTGAPCMSALAALRCGSGLVTAAVPASLNPIFEIKLTEVMTLPLPDENGTFLPAATEALLPRLADFQAIAFGMGAGTGDGTRAILKTLLQNYHGTLILDADALNVLSKEPLILRSKNCNVIVTPHPGEMSRLCKQSVSQVQADRESFAATFAKTHDCITVLKGNQTVICEQERIVINPTGNVGMATGGTGDVLSGMIASFAGQGLSPFDSVALGCYLHGLAGDIACRKRNPYAMIASDVIDNISEAINLLIEKAGQME